MMLSNIRNIDQSESFFIIIMNLDQLIRCCVKSSMFRSGDYSVQQSRTGCVVLVDGLIRMSLQIV